MVKRTLVQYCRIGDIKKAKEVINSEYYCENIYDLAPAVNMAINHENYHIAEWLLDTYNDKSTHLLYRKVICCNRFNDDGYIWLLNKIKKMNDKNLLDYSNLLPIKPHLTNGGTNFYGVEEMIFVNACKSGYFSLAKWIKSYNSSYCKNSHNSYNLLSKTYDNGHFEIARWMYLSEKEFSFHNSMYENRTMKKIEKTLYILEMMKLPLEIDNPMLDINVFLVVVWKFLFK